MSLRSIRSRLTLWYALTLVIFIGGAGVFWYHFLARDMLQNLDARLLLIAEDVASFHMMSFHEAEFPAENPCEDVRTFISRHTWGEYVQLRNGEGTVCCVSENLGEERLPLSSQALAQASKGETWIETDRDGKGRHLRVLTMPVFHEGQRIHYFQVGAEMEAIEAPLENLLLILAIFSPLLIFFLCLGGWFISRKALAPVDQIIREVQQINAQNLSLRLRTNATGDEITQLAETFNSMLTRLEESFNKTRQFSADASHELRTPLAILRGETEVGLRWAKTPEEFRQVLESNMEEIDRMARIIEDLLTLSKSEAGGTSLVMKTFNLSDLVQSLYIQGKTLAEAKQIRVAFNLDVDREVMAKGDQLRLHQALLNFLSNAIKYTQHHGRIEISLSLLEDEAAISISDTGVGIPREHLPHIFDRFYRVDEHRNRAEGGAGLGLAIAKWIIDAHKGRIEVQSEVNRGSCFTIYLPLGGPPGGGPTQK